MLVMQEPMKASSILVPDTSDKNFASSGSSSLEYLGLYNWGRVLIKQARRELGEEIAKEDHHGHVH